ncbi:MAG: hypothetical protein CVV22_11400 [Ignavibacteriae bacterium HGW-Ignavibacteriae-1]|nr:MAG: hypothetical protein CVV22_11400 [Ignavibacteriae bacterium HGW-Ignavibacteriae-1]
MKIEFVKRLLFFELVSNKFTKNYQSQIKRNWTSMENDSIPIKDIFYMHDNYIQTIKVWEDTTNDFLRDRFKIYMGYQCCTSPFNQYYFVAIGAGYRYYFLGGFKTSSFNEFIKNEIRAVDEANVMEIAKLYYRTMEYEYIDIGFRWIETLDELKLYNLEDKASLPKITIMNNTLVLETYFHNKFYNDLYLDTFIFKDNQLFDFKRNVVIEGEPDEFR